MGAMGHTKTIEMKIPQENKKEYLKFAKTFELKLPIADIVMSMKSRCEPTESYLVSIKPNPHRSKRSHNKHPNALQSFITCLDLVNPLMNTHDSFGITF